MSRSFADTMGFKWPKNVALIEFSGYGGKGRPVTWDELHDRRRKRQAERLKNIMRPSEPEIVPCYVWTFFNRQSIPYHGWYCYVISRHFQIGVNFRGFDLDLATSIMTALPLGMLGIKENFDLWMQAFAEHYPRDKYKQDPRKAGSCIGWIAKRRRFTLERPSTCFDCGVTLNEKNHTNKDNVLDATGDTKPICDGCSEEQWKRIKWHDEETP
jgi:hypothetical protein